MTSSERNTHAVRPGIVLLSLVALLAVVIFGGYRITHHRSTDADSLLVNRTQSIAPIITTAITTPTANQAPAVMVPRSRTTSIHRVAVADGLRIDVVSMQCGLSKVGSGYAKLAATPGSQYCLVRLEVKNISSSPNVGFAGSATAYDARGNSFSSESEADLYVSNSALMDPLNPGIELPDVVPFELSKSDRLVRISFYAGFAKAPVSVPLT